ncbi:condensation domain-containing protein [Lentzea sp. NPDC059081]|uniref:condensation domain-containing protein n=1 Tax=Lentzea sp. NPDC059081 TaxID=3346719 RepID=UPI00367A0B24
MTTDDTATGGASPFDDLPDDCVLVPAGSAQRGLWLTQALDPASPAYLITHAFELRGELDVAALAEALDGLVARHEALRTGFLGHGEEIHQVIHDVVPPVLRVENAADEETALAAIDRESGTPFDLTRPALLRVLVLRLGAGRHMLSVALHHIVVEGVSVELLWTELEVLYRAACVGAPALLPELPLQYADYAAWEHEWIAGTDYAGQLGFWREELAGAPAAIDLPAPAAGDRPSWQGGTHAVELTEAETASVLAFARDHQATPFMVLLMVFGGVLHRWSGQPDVVVGTPVTLRDRPGLEHVVGVLINSLPLRLRWQDNPTGATALDRVRETTGNALARKRVPFDHLVAALPGLRAPGRDPVMQVMFAYGAEDGGAVAVNGLRLRGLAVSRLDLRAGTAKFDLSLDCVLTGGRLRCVLEWSDQRFDREFAEIFAEHLVVALRHVVAHDGDRVGDWPLPCEDEEQESDWPAGFLHEELTSWTVLATEGNR